MSGSPVYGWPFLVARGRRLGYQPLLVPAFLAETGEDDLLDHAGRADSAVELTVVNGAAAGEVVLASRSERLSQSDAGWAGEPVTDEFGRPLELLYGFAVRAGGLRRLDSADLGTARADAFQAYQRFLADESGFQRQISEPFTLRSTPGQPVDGSTARPDPESPATSNSRKTLSTIVRRGLVVIVGLIALAVAAVVWSLMTGPRGPITAIDVAGLGTAAVDCGQPITIQATIVSNDRATVSYHWESTLTDASTPLSVDFPAAGTRQVETTVRLEAEPGAPITFVQTLVVDAPNSAKDSRKFILTCR